MPSVSAYRSARVPLCNVWEVHSYTRVLTSMSPHGLAIATDANVPLQNVLNVTRQRKEIVDAKRVLWFLSSFWLSLPELRPTFSMGCSTKCALLRRSGAASKSVGASDGPVPTGTHRAPSTHWKSTSGPVKLRKATVPPLRCSYLRTHALDDWFSMP